MKSFHSFTFHLNGDKLFQPALNLNEMAENNGKLSVGCGFRELFTVMAQASGEVW